MVKHAAFLNLATGKVEYSANVTGYEEVDSNRVRLVLDEPKRLPKPIPRGHSPWQPPGAPLLQPWEVAVEQDPRRGIRLLKPNEERSRLAIRWRPSGDPTQTAAAFEGPVIYLSS